MTYLKKLIGNKFQQNYLPELLPIVPLNIHRKPWRWGESHPTAKNVLIYPTRKIPVMKFTSAIKSVIPSLWNSNFHLLVTIAMAVVSFFNLHMAHMCCVVLILINRCLLNVVLSRKKALNNQSSLKQKFYSLHLSILLLVFLFFPLPFFQTLWNFTWLHSIWDFMACQLIRYDIYSKLVGLIRWNPLFNVINCNSWEQTLK